MRKIIGRDPDCDFVILDPQRRVSRRHLEMKKEANVVYLKDLGSKNGTFIDGKKLIPEAWVPLNTGSTVTLSSDYSFNWMEVFPPEMEDSTRIFFPKQEAGDDATRVFNQSEKVLILDAEKTSLGEVSSIDQTKFVFIGRDPECQIKIDNPKVSRKHCQIRMINESLVEIEDLGSTNGTFVDGEKLTPNKRQILSAASEIRLGSDHPLSLSKVFPNLKIPVRQVQNPNQRDENAGPRLANPFELASFNSLEEIWKEYQTKMMKARNIAISFGLGGSALGVGAAVATAAAGPLGLLLMAGGGILGRYLGQHESNKIQNDLSFEDMFLSAYSCPRCKESFQKKAWITIRECNKCKLKFRT
jgi:pSer/pThr/pTyr-binding forkhead associated (FHA) protein